MTSARWKPRDWILNRGGILRRKRAPSGLAGWNSTSGHFPFCFPTSLRLFRLLSASVFLPARRCSLYHATNFFISRAAYPVRSALYSWCNYVLSAPLLRPALRYFFVSLSVFPQSYAIKKEKRRRSKRSKTMSIEVEKAWQIKIGHFDQESRGISCRLCTISARCVRRWSMC